ncbi:MAG: NAD-dependent epimerase/dehydratase family protein [Candidatus Dojkabacteria bacterium]|nr:MAG: NAD-dependent epimerase/dehydratase family protein [Candidatus Dojkabacteria bacterium]
MKNILITGAAGFIGSSLAERLSQNKEYSLVLVDNFLTGKEQFIVKKDNTQFIKADVNQYEDIAPLMSANRFDYVFHYAAVVGVQRTLQNPVMVLHDIEGLKNILSLAKNTGVERVFFSSSSEVYGEPVEIPQNESTTPLNARLPYAIVKNLGEAFLRSYQQEYGLNYTIFRFFNTYGARQSPDFVMSKFIQKAKKNEDITVYGDGSQTRTFCYVEDNLDATVRTLEENLFVNDVVNIGSDIEISILDLAKLIIEITGSESKIVHLPPLKEGDMSRRKPDVTNMKKLLQHDFTPIEEGIRKVIEAQNAQ